ncbi:GntR family transcriptional regulator [Collimonas sp.]|jgi:DNA-binding GntR family transcriptional regulator|uniref:GntR family transcriptional regulator n=1 Tax=Collimonas sp. TaxID=1963772 RepID=UPI002C21A71F|nr:GntR family transcriptional regulator [Collimonas sp.]HWW05260.1 GntR family transcriptional regulator [Collimonas sp.]
MSQDESVSQAERISRAIEADILSAAYPPGERLDERQLGARFGVSRTPVREALNRLVADGLAEHRARQGVFVARISLASVFELFEMLAVMESASARLAARRMKADDVQRLLQLADETVLAAASDDATVYTSANTRFHELIYTGSCNRLLEESAKQLRRRAAPYREHIHRVAGRRSATAQEHVAIAAAIRAGEGQLAADLMFQHLDIHRPEFADYVFILSRTVENVMA